MNVDAARKMTLGKYQLIASLGQGGMANVYLALVAGPAGFNKLLVVKSLREDVVNNIDGGTAMSLDEARLTARMVHPNIVGTYEVGENDGTFFLAMEYLEGQSYRALCNRGRPDQLAIAEELRILSETARGLHYAHELANYDGTPLHVVHRDVSPQNIFITYDGQVKLLDFGIAKTNEAEHLTQVGVIKGKIDYIAPEQLRGDAIDRRADVFALGAMLWEVVTGKRFAGGRKLPEVTKAQNRLTGGERKVRELQPELPDALARIVDRSTALHAGDRYESAAAFADAIEAYLASSSLKPSAQSLGEVMGPLFEVERQRMRKLVEEQVQLSKQRGSGSIVAPLPAMRTLDGESTSGVWLGEDTTRQPPRSLLPLAPAGSVHVPARRSRLGAVAAVIVLGAMVGGSLAVMTGRPPEAAATPATPPAPTAPRTVEPSEPVATAPVEATTVRLEVTASPAEATATLDGAPITLPFTGEFRLDATLHHLEVAADGFRPSKKLIAFDRDLSLALTLEKNPAPIKRARPNVRAVEAAPPAVASVPASPPAKESLAPRGRANVRSLDPEDPYAN